MDKVTTFFNKCETSVMNQLIKAVFKIGLCSLDLQLLLQMYTEGSGRRERGQIQTSWRGAGQTELAVQTGASLSLWTLKEERKDKQSKIAGERV